MFAFACFVAISSVAMAESTSTRKEQASSTRQEVRARVQEKTDQACQTITTRIDKRLADFTSRFETHRAAYQTHRDKLAKISSKLQSEGLNAVRLNQDIATLDQKIAVFRNDRNAVENALAATKGYACGTMDGQFRESVETLRITQRKMMTTAKDISDFIRIDLKQSMIELRNEYAQ